MRLLLDNCVIDKLGGDDKTFSLLKELKQFSTTELFICQSVIDKIGNLPNEKKEKRIVTLNRLFSLGPAVLKDNFPIFDNRIVDYSTFFDNEIYQKVLKSNNVKTQDAIHAEISVINRLKLVTENKYLYNAMKSLEYDVCNLAELRDQKTIVEEIYPILKQGYKNGFVCYFDILGFSSFSSKEENFERIKKLVTHLQTLIKTNDLAHLMGKITLFSDSIFFTAEDNELSNYTFFTSIIDFVCTARNFVQDSIGTDIQAGISYGKYIHLNSGEIYGPAVVQSVLLTENKREDSPLHKYLSDNLAAIIIHENVFSSPVNKYDILLRLFNDHPERYKKIGETNFFIVNPYYFIYMTKSVGQELSTGKNLDKKQICTHWRHIIDDNKGHQNKYRLTSKYLDEFINDDSIK